MYTCATPDSGADQHDIYEVASTDPHPLETELTTTGSSMRVSANTPVSRVGACVAHFPRRASLPHIDGRSTLATHGKLGLVLMSAVAGSTWVVGCVHIGNEQGDDCAALVAFYNGTGGPHGSSNDNWLTDTPLEDWYGADTDAEGRVVVLALPRNNLNGSIPPELGYLDSLESLPLYSNQLTGPIPPELGEFSNLILLDLDADELTGAIPRELGNLPSLRRLYLTGNNLSGPIPPEIGNVSFLTGLYLSSNALTGIIPPELGNLVHL